MLQNFASMVYLALPVLVYSAWSDANLIRDIVGGVEECWAYLVVS
jgi:hypothetical protein